METFISIVGSICGSITGIATENAVGPITRQLSYLFKHRTKFQNLRNKVQELKAAGERVEQSVREAKMNGEVIFPDVETWLTVVNEKISDQAATQLEEDEEKFKRRCFAGYIKVVINSMMSVPCLELLSLWNLTDLEAIFDDQLKAASFDRLRIIRVWNGKKLNNLFSFSMATELHQLEQIYVSNCDYMIGLIVVKEETGDDEILEFRQLSSLYLKDLSSFKSLWYSEETLESVPCLFDKKVILPVLEELSIEDMDNLERLWPNQLSQHSFSKLTSIQLRRCPKLLDVFPSSMLTRFQRLNQLSIRNCKSVEEIVFESHPQEESRAMQSFSPQLIQSDVIISEFPCLTSLVLGGLPNLRSIHREMLTINWPSLKEMEVEGCDKVEILFASQETTGFPVQQPLFWVNQSTFPKLHQLTLGGNAGMKETWYSDGQQLVFHHFPNLEVVKLEEYTDQALPLPSYLFTLLSSPNLQTLEIRRCSFQEIMFQSEEGGEEKSAWVRKFNLVPSSVSFRNLVTLRVELCHGIIKLITHSTAKSLVQLREMRISDCQDIEEIIQGADDDDEIHFPQLNHLELTGLPKLESFCSSRNHTFEFPSLQTYDYIGGEKKSLVKAALIAPYNSSSEKRVEMTDVDGVEEDQGILTLDRAPGL
ncbi:hypothetical protein V6N13_090680 [Hibiscus sabdariffa]